VRNATRCLLALAVVASAFAPAVAVAQGYARPVTDYGGQPKKSGLSAMADSIGSGIKRGVDKVSRSLHPAAEPSGTSDPTRLSSNATPGPELYVAVAKAQEERKRYHEAEAQYAKALGAWPNDLPSMLAYAQYLDRRGRVDEAIQQYEQAVRVHPREATAWNHLGLCHAEHKGFPKAASALEQAVKLEPTQPLYRNNLAVVLVEMDRYADAYANLRAVQDEATAYYNLGYVLQERNKNEAAARHFAAALRANPQLSDARTWLDHLQSSEQPSRRTTVASQPPTQPVTVAARPAFAERPTFTEPATVALPQLTTPERTPSSAPSSAELPPIRLTPAAPSADRRETSAVQQLPPVPRPRQTESRTAASSLTPFRSRSAPPLPRLTSPNPVGSPGVTDRVTEPERASAYPDPSAPSESGMIAPLPPVSDPPSTKSFGTRGTNVIYPLPPVDASSGR
jgi:tetratricopeptide (TPR) repeat protein